MNNPSFDLIDIAKAIFRRKVFILIFTLCSVGAGLLLCLLSKDEYTAKSSFIIKSTTAMDRNHIFQRDFYQINDFFAPERDIDNIETIAKSDRLLGHLIDKFDLQNVYNQDDISSVFKTLKKRFKYTRNSTKNINIEIADHNPELAYHLTLEATKEIENIYREFFNANKKDLIIAINAKIESVSEEINQLNDSIDIIRNEYQLENYLVPSRGKTISNLPTGRLSAKSAQGLEILQSYTSVKDQLIEDRSSYYTLRNEYSLGIQDSELNMFYMIESPYVPQTKSFPKIPLILLISAVLGAGFSVILVLFSEYFQKLRNANL